MWRHAYLELQAQFDDDRWQWLRGLTDDAVAVRAGTWDEESERRYRLALREASWSVSAAIDWRAAALRYTTFADLELLRNTPAWVEVCAHPDCRWMTTVYDAAERSVLCPAHRNDMAVTA